MTVGEPYPVGFKVVSPSRSTTHTLIPPFGSTSYAMAMGIQGHSELLAARYLPLMMDGVNRHWFNTLTVNSIDSWEEARAAFIQHFASAYTRATTIEDLDRCVQGPRESTRRDNISISELFDIATRYADEDPTVDNDDERCWRYAQEAIITRAPREDRPQPKRFDARSLLDAPCIYHSKEGKPANHTTGNCYSLKQIERARRAKENDGGNQHKDRAKDQDQHKGEGFGRSAGSLHTFTGVGDRRDRKVLARAVAVHAVILSDVPRWLNWSEQSITWSREDHAPRIEYPGRVALVVRPKVADLSKTPMDGGKLHQHHVLRHLPAAWSADSRLESTKVELSEAPALMLPPDVPPPMATPRLRVHNMMKMPGPRGVITVHGDPEMALECEDDSAKLADVIADEQDNSTELAKYPSTATTRHPGEANRARLVRPSRPQQALAK
ncbi:hypothetical protein QYE76_060562 [Lolium multiflorum]|uniref:Retrotransposon gag domain-containing protein n=1 Tax=Lolium multiflorum TaxID=4521 RepID=A0AAD8RZH3_LOLMU|nr:hypothetical protein QYE76_060562 [Lolium multiflorum]